jgi:uncharacterized protein with PIN domain
MSRIRRAFENRFRELLAEVGARERQKGIDLLFAQAADLSRAENVTLSRGLAEVNLILAQKIHRFALRKGIPKSDRTPKIICDAGLAGLARWLRASGCETLWIQNISDERLLEEAERLGAILITTDSFLLDRKPIKEGRVRAYWVPPTLTKFEQLRLLRAELNLPESESRCMRCGGELIEVDKEAVKDRIPPKTLKWVNEYFQCGRCGQIYWHGTHWQKIARELEKSVAE